MGQAFFRFPHTPHLAWLGDGQPRDDKVLSVSEARDLLSGDVVVEEKLDGANLGFSVDANGRLRAQNRGHYLVEPFGGQFARLAGWLGQHANAMITALGFDLTLFGEWCAARHSVPYDRLPDWFVVFDVYDRVQGRFWNCARRNELARQLDLSHVPQLVSGHLAVAKIQEELNSLPSRYREGPMEGVVVRRDSAQWCESRAKLVRAGFTQAIGEHWRRRSLEWNRIAAQTAR